MENEYIIKMKDGGLIDVHTDQDCVDKGCVTCGYGSKYVTFIKLELDGFKIHIDLSNMYTYPYSQSELMKLLCSNIKEIENMTQKEFADFIKKEIIKVCKKEGYNYEPEFDIVMDY